MVESTRVLPFLFKELYISTDRNGLTHIGIYDQGYEIFDVDDLIKLRAHINSVILYLKFPKNTE